MEDDGSYSDEEEIDEKKPFLWHLQEEIDITKVPSHIIKGLKPASGKNVVIQLEELRPENASEVWILQCPAEVKLRQLIQGKRLFLDNRSQVFTSEASEKRFEAVCLKSEEGEEEGGVVLLPDDSGKMQLASFPVTGTILIKEAVEETPNVIPVPSPKKGHKFPPGVKVRHPVYGADYDETILDLPPQPTKKKSRKKAELERQNGGLLEANEIQSPTKKSRKRRAETNLEINVIKQESPRKKRHKESYIEPETGIDESPVREFQDEIKVEVNSDVEFEDRTKKKKKLRQSKFMGGHSFSSPTFRSASTYRSGLH